MRCLFCGKELALLKRLRGGAEFCSEAHRKEYHEQFEQLGLARLLQAQPRSQPLPPGKSLLGRPSAALPIAATQDAQDAEDFETLAASVAIDETSAPDQRVSTPAKEATPAPLAGFVNEPLVPAVTPFRYSGLLELVTAPPSLPAVGATASSDSEACLPPAPRVQLELSLRALDHHTRNSERGVELREFAAPAPIMELNLRPDTGKEPAGADDVMEILMSPHPPQKAKPWLGVPRGFPPVPAELGQLARLDFRTTGFAYSDGPLAGPAQTAPAPQAAVLAPPAEPARVVTPSSKVPPAEVAPAQPVPELVTKVLPVTLHGLAASRGRLAQAFSSSLTPSSDVQIPPSVALPLRPAIVFGPAPAPARTPEAAASPVQPTRVQPVQPAPVQQPKRDERVRPSVVPAPKPVPVKRSVAPETSAPKVATPAAPPVNPRVEQRAEARPEPRREWPAPAASDAAVPSMRLEATESAWSKLSGGLKIGVAAAVIVAISGIGYVITRGNGKTTSQKPAATPSGPTVATGVPISGGWIDDWANFSKTRRRISVLSGSAKLSDYRLEFQAQVQTKAIGWIFRGLNPRNYYVAKLETVTPGLEPTLALVHFAVVDGEDENRKVVPLPMKVRVDTVYRIRFDAIGNRFTTWVQDQKIDEWTDSRFGSGGVGFFSEANEQAALQGTVNVVPLVPKN